LRRVAKLPGGRRTMQQRLLSGAQRRAVEMHTGMCG